MSLGIRGFVEYLINKVQEEGVLGSGYSESERIDDIIKMIWEAYESF